MKNKKNEGSFSEESIAHRLTAKQIRAEERKKKLLEKKAALQKLVEEDQTTEDSEEKIEAAIREYEEWMKWAKSVSSPEAREKYRTKIEKERQEAAEKMAKWNLIDEQRAKERVELKEWLHTRNQDNKFGHGDSRFGPEETDDLDGKGSKLIGDADHKDG